MICVFFYIVWQECYDDVSGFIYYWNTQTNKVTWEKPEHYEAAHSIENQGMLNNIDKMRVKCEMSVQ